MKQSWLATWAETIGNTATGFLVSIVLQYAVCWYYALPLVWHDNLIIIGLFTVASILRGIGWRRLMERLHVRQVLSPFMLAVAAERRRQVEGENWSAENDDLNHERGALAYAGACYAMFAKNKPGSAVPDEWRWDPEWWKPAEFRRNLIKAAALIAAEGEKFDRAKTPRSAL